MEKWTVTVNIEQIIAMPLLHYERIIPSSALAVADALLGKRR